MMYVSERDALLFSILVLAIGIVTLRIAALAERERARAAAEATRRQLVAAVSHDLRTPIASLRLLVEAVDDEIVDEETRRRYLATMQTHIDSLSAMIDDLFELSRIEAGDIEWSMRQVELALLVDETVAAMQPEAGAKGVEIHTQLGEGPLAARADPEKIQRVLFNLIRNAIRHTPADGSVTVRAEAGGGGVEIEIADTGDGIPAEERERVFDAFFRGGEDASAAFRRRRPRPRRLPRDRRDPRRPHLAGAGRAGNPGALQPADRGAIGVGAAFTLPPDHPTGRSRRGEKMTKLTPKQAELCETSPTDFSDLRALFINCTLKRSPEVSNTQGLVDISMEIMRRQGVQRRRASAPSTTTSPPASGPT